MLKIIASYEDCQNSYLIEIMEHKTDEIFIKFVQDFSKSIDGVKFICLWNNKITKSRILHKIFEE